MKQAKKKQYVKPRLSAHGSVEAVTGWTKSGTGEFFGGAPGTVATKSSGPADFGS